MSSGSHELTHRTATEVVRRALELADEQGLKVGVVVVDAAGHDIASGRHHASYLSTLEIAKGKAFTAANFRVPTHQMAERLGSIDYALQISLADRRLAFIKGGVPVQMHGEVVGAVGVSGGSADQDLEIGLRAVEDAVNAAAGAFHMTQILDPRPVWTGTSGAWSVTGLRCPAGHTTCEEAPVCPACRRPVERTQFAGHGIIWAVTVCRVASEPYGLAYLDLDDGPRVLARFRAETPLRVGARAEVRTIRDGNPWLEVVA